MCSFGTNQINLKKWTYSENLLFFFCLTIQLFLRKRRIRKSLLSNNSIPLWVEKELKYGHVGRLSNRRTTRVRPPFGGAGCIRAGRFSSQTCMKRMGTPNSLCRGCHALWTFKTITTTQLGMWSIAKQNFCPFPLYPFFLVAVWISSPVLHDSFFTGPIHYLFC